jgi:hypothetical protein
VESAQNELLREKEVQCQHETYTLLLDERLRRQGLKALDNQTVKELISDCEGADFRL